MTYRKVLFFQLNGFILTIVFFLEETNCWIWKLLKENLKLVRVNGIFIHFPWRIIFTMASYPSISIIWNSYLKMIYMLSWFKSSISSINSEGLRERSTRRSSNKRPSCPDILQEQRTALVEPWEEITQGLVVDLIRLGAVVQPRGSI